MALVAVAAEAEAEEEEQQEEEEEEVQVGGINASAMTGWCHAGRHGQAMHGQARARAAWKPTAGCMTGDHPPDPLDPLDPLDRGLCQAVLLPPLSRAHLLLLLRLHPGLGVMGVMGTAEPTSLSGSQRWSALARATPTTEEGRPRPNECAGSGGEGCWRHHRRARRPRLLWRCRRCWLARGREPCSSGPNSNCTISSSLGRRRRAMADSDQDQASGAPRTQPRRPRERRRWERRLWEGAQEPSGARPSWCFRLAPASTAAAVDRRDGRR